MKLSLNPSLSEKINDAIEDELTIVENGLKSTVVDLKEVTPKRTGYAASRWQYNVDNEYKFSISLKNTFLIKIEKELSYFISNDATYISNLNAGSSIQAPAYFVEQTILNNGFVPT